ncbi:MAG: glutamate--cysteine ligase [Aestuariibacter sp.]
MQEHNRQFDTRLTFLSDQSVKPLLTDIQHGIEREALRVNADGSLAQTDHHRELGSSLTHHFITTDFSESLLEFITPPERKIPKTMAQLFDIHKFVLQTIGEERLWPMSMPCFIRDQNEIRLAQYGTSNVGKMKTLYRQGLKNRYGSMMQAIAGVHFNFSMPVNFWQPWFELTRHCKESQQNVSDAYFGMVRNYRRHCWMLPFFFGASPALCSSFLEGKSSPLQFSKLGEGTIYSPYATSLRMSDLGYTNSAQSNLNICYNHIDSYVESLRRAINTPSERFAKFAGKIDGQYQQLNSNVLQIENELYSPVRPKQPTRSLEKPSDALAERGVSYVEVRALDVNPFSPVGIEPEQIHFLDVFMVHCLITPGLQMPRDEFVQSESNLRQVVAYGRDPACSLTKDNRPVALHSWANELLAQMQDIAGIMDDVHQTKVYSKAIAAAQQQVQEPELTVSGRILKTLKEEKLDNGELALKLAEEHKAALLAAEYKIHDAQFFKEQALHSWDLQHQIEANDKVDFDTFLLQQFGK